MMGSTSAVRKSHQGIAESLASASIAPSIGALCICRNTAVVYQATLRAGRPLQRVRLVASFVTVDDPRELLEAGRFEDLAHDDHPLWRGLALLELRKHGEAARIFEEAPDAAQSGTMLELAGAARWLAGDRELAVERWISALDAPYDGPAGGVKPPALLYYAGLRIPEDRYVLRGTRLLGKLWKPKLSRVWPGPVAGYLLDKVEETAFLEDGYEDPDLESRRLASARFWAGVKAKDPETARVHFEASAGIEGASALEVEHHLARGEIQSGGK